MEAGDVRDLRGDRLGAHDVLAVSPADTEALAEAARTAIGCLRAGNVATAVAILDRYACPTQARHP